MSLLKTHLGDSAQWEDDRGHPTPAGFGDAAAERAALERGAALLDLTHQGVVAVTGEEREHFLHGLICNQIKDASPTRAIYAALLTPQGRYLFDFTITVEGQGYRLFTGPDRVAALVSRLRMYLLRTQAAIEDLSINEGVLAVAGPGAAQALMATFPHLQLADAPLGAAFTAESGVQLWRDPRHEAFGWRLAASDTRLPELWQRLARHARPVGMRAWEHFRIGRMLPRGGAELIPDSTLPLEAGLKELNGVSFTKGCYVGQETTARTHGRGTIKKRLYGLTLAAETPPGTPVVTAGGKETGVVTSCACLGDDCVGLALLRVSDLEGDPSLSAGEGAATAHRPPWATW